MSKKLVAYFSATGTTAKVAKTLAKAAGADIFEVVPKVAYIKADLDWTNKNSRSTVEMNNPSSRPEIESKCDSMNEYDTIFVGFPIWWYVAPTIKAPSLKAMTWRKKQSFLLQHRVVVAWEKLTKTLRQVVRVQSYWKAKCFLLV